MKKKELIFIGVLALVGGYLFWHYKRPNKLNYNGLMYHNNYDELPIRDELEKYNIPKFGVPEIIVNR
jgi:hypothetical protein